MKITCPQCRKDYTFNEGKIPPGAGVAKCRACGQLIPLYRTSERLADTGPQIHPSAGAAIIVACSHCRKKYRIHQNQIPPSARAFKCKACGHRISLPPPSAVKPSLTVTPIKSPAEPATIPDAHLQKPSAPRDRLPENSAAPILQSRKKMWWFAAAAGIMLVVIIGVLAGGNLINPKRDARIRPAADDDKPAGPVLPDREPFVVLNLNVPLILGALENRFATNAKPLPFQAAVSILKALDLKRLELYLYPGRANQFVPVFVARDGNRKHLAALFRNKEPLQRYFEPKAVDTFRLKTDLLEKADSYSFATEAYEVTLVEKGACFAPVSYSGVIKNNPQLFLDSQVAQSAGSIENQATLFVTAIRISEDLQTGWEQTILQHPALGASPEATMIAGIAAEIISQLADPLKSVETLALAFQLTGMNGRILHYAQQFRADIDAAKVYRRLTSGEPQDETVAGIVRQLAQLFEDSRYKHQLVFKDNRLELKFSWSAKDDPALLAALSRATTRELFSRNMKLKPSESPVETQYTDDPQLMTTVDVKRLKPRIPAIFKQNLFPGHFWNSGDKPQMTLDLDPVDLPNAELAELSYEVVSIESPQGQNVLRREDTRFKRKINPGSLFPGSLSLSINPGTPPEALGTAKINFNLSLPVELQVFNFKKGTEAGHSKEAGTVRVRLERIENDVAEVSYEGGKSIHLVAYDQSGRALTSSDAMRSDASASARFQGKVDSLKVVVAGKMLEYPFEVDVDLNGGKALTLSQKPEIPVRIRHDHQPVPTYVGFSDQDLTDLRVEWFEGNDLASSDNLLIRLPKGPYRGHAKWEVHFFADNKPQVLSGNSVQGVSDASYRLEKGSLKKAQAAFGTVLLNFQTDITRLRFENQAGNDPKRLTLPSGESISVRFNQNEITYRTGNARAIQTIAYDDLGKRLKQDSYSRNKGASRIIYFWGQPAKFEIDVATGTAERRIQFDIKHKPLDESAYQVFKQTIENQREIVNTLKSVDRGRRKDRSYYGDDLAGLYYLYDRQQKKPMALISETIAHADPAGQERFGYRLTPYRGYYFSVLQGIEANSTRQAYTRRSEAVRFTWQKGTVTTTPLTRHPDLVAFPQDESQPTFFLQWGQVFMKLLDGEKLEFLPENYYTQGWRLADFIEG